MLMARHSRRKLFSNMSLARHIRSTRNCAESRKFVFGCDTVEFADFFITLTDILPRDENNRAIRDFPTSEIITDIQSRVVFINQVSYCDSLRNDMPPFQEQLKLC